MNISEMSLMGQIATVICASALLVVFFKYVVFPFLKWLAGLVEC